MENHWFYILTNNQSFAVAMGFFGLLIGYSIWKKQHNKELCDKYFTEYLDASYRFVAIKKEEADLRKGKNRNCNESDSKNDEKLTEINIQLSELNRQEIQNEGLIKSRKFLLRELKDVRWESVNKIKIDFGKKFNDFSKKPVCGKDKLATNVYEEAVNCINASIDEILDKLEKQ